MKIRLAIWFLLLSCVTALPLGNNGVPPFFGAPASCGTYTGLSDLVSGISAWWGARALGSSACGTKALNVCNSTGGVDVACIDMSTSPVTGDLVVTTIGGLTCASLGTNCTIKIAYDQSGFNGCQAPANIPCDISQSTIANRPTLTTSCIGSLPCIGCSGSNQWLQSTTTNSPAVTQPFTVSTVAKRNGSAYGPIYSQTTFTSGPMMNFFTSANLAAIYDGGSFFSASAADGALHAMQGVYVNASSTLAIDGSSTTGGSVGTGTGGGFLLMCSDVGGGGGGFFLNGQVMELGYWKNTGFSAGQITSVNANQHAYWGF